MFPVRCYTCNAVLAHKYPTYRVRLRDDGAAAALAELGVTRMCCRRMFLSHVDLVDGAYPNVDVVLDDSGTRLRRHVHFARTVSCD